MNLCAVCHTPVPVEDEHWLHDLDCIAQEDCPCDFVAHPECCKPCQNEAAIREAIAS